MRKGEKTVAIVMVLVFSMFLMASSGAGATKLENTAKVTLSITLVGLGVADTALSIYGTSHYGLVESNTLLRPLFEKRHYAAIWAIEFAGTAALLTACLVLTAQKSRAPRIVGYALFGAAVVARGLIVASNARLNHRGGR